MIVALFIGLTIYFNLDNSTVSYAAVSGEYRSAGSGNWNLITTWQKYNGSAWLPAVTVPDSSSNIITIQSGHNVTVTANQKADQLVVSSGGTLTLNSGVTLTVSNGTGTDMSVSGTFVNAGTVTIRTGAAINFSSTGKYQHNFTTTAGTIPTATWSSGSTCEIIGYTSNPTAPSGIQTFSNFTWNCPSQSNDIRLNGALTTISSNFIVASTGSKSLQLAAANSTLSVGGGLTISGGSLVCQTQDNTSFALTVSGNFSQSSGTFNLLNSKNCTGTFNISGNYTLSAGTFIFTDRDNNTINSTISGNFSQTGGTNSCMLGKSERTNLTVNGNFAFSSGTFAFANDASDTVIVNLKGNYSHTGGTLSINGSNSYAQMIFSKSGRQTFTASGNTVSGSVDFYVNSGSTLSLSTNILTGRNFTLQSGGALELGSAEGISSSGSTGNIQVSGTRTFSTTGDYTYNGSATQVTGSGLPSGVRNLTLNNSTGLTLSAGTTVSGTLTLTSGKITTGSYELAVSNTATGSIVSSSSNYIIGNLRRSVSASGTYSFPLGTSTNYERATLALTGVAGFTSVLGSFTNADPLDPSNPLSSIEVSGVDMTDLLDYGYWTLTPNGTLSSGTFTVTMGEKGYSNVLTDGSLISLLQRDNASSAWTSTGTHSDNTQSVSAGTVTAARSSMSTFGQFAIAFGDFPSFSSSSLYSGTDGQIGAIYIFPNVTRGVDAWVEIMDIQGGATLDNIDDQSTGYTVCFQPFINYAVNTEGYFEWKISFKKAGTPTDTTLRKLTATGVDVDGGSSGGKQIREYIEATMPTSYSLDAASTLTITNNNGRYRALGGTGTFSNIDTVNHTAMYELYYTNVNTIYYRTGSISTYSSIQTRQTSLYFKSFNLSVKNIALPIELMYFKAYYKDKAVNLNWATATEVNNDYFTVERSSDGINFEPIQMIRGAGNSTSVRDYSWTDSDPLEGYSFYRLKQTDYDGHYTYSDVETIKSKGGSSLEEAFEIKSIFPNPFSDRINVDFLTKQGGEAEITLLSESGSIVASTKMEVHDGYNNGEINNLGNLPKGTYILTLFFDEYKVSKKVVKYE